MKSRIMLAFSLSILLAALIAVAPGGSAQPIPVQPQPGMGISVVGQGIVVASPNVAKITLGVDIADLSLANAQAEAARRMDAVVAKLKADGIADTDIRTVSFSVSPQYDQQGQSLRGYRVQNTVEAKTKNVGGLGALIDDVVSSGATRVFGINFESDNMEALKTQARDQAMQNARSKGEQLARDAGVSLGRPVSIDESDTGGVTPVRANAVPQAAAPAAVTTPVEAGELRVSTTVRVVWSIQ